MIAQQIDAGEVESVQFAFEIIATPSESPVGYEYTAKPLIAPSLSDPLAELRNRALMGYTPPMDAPIADPHSATHPVEGARSEVAA